MSVRQSMPSRRGSALHKLGIPLVCISTGWYRVSLGFGKIHDDNYAFRSSRSFSTSMESDLQQCIATFGSAFLSTTSTSFWTHQGMSTLKRQNLCKRWQWVIECNALVFVAWLWFHSCILFLSYSFSSALDASLHPWQRQLCARSLLSCWLIAINKNSKQPSHNWQRTHSSGDQAIVQQCIPLWSYDFDEWCTFCDLCGSKTLSNDAWNILRKHSRNDLLDAIRQHQCCAVLAGDSLIQKACVWTSESVAVCNATVDNGYESHEHLGRLIKHQLFNAH